MIFQDFKYALRLLAKKPGFTALTTLVMAAGIGLSVYMISFFNTILYKDLDLKDGNSLVLISASHNGVNNTDKINLLDFNEIKNSIKGLSEFTGYINNNVTVSSRDGARRYNVVLVQPEFFKITRTKPILGRDFVANENLSGANKVVVIGYDIWQKQFGGNPKVLEQSLQINGNNHQIIGVMPQGYLFPNIAQMWLPMIEDNTKSTRIVASDLHGLAHIDDAFSMDEIDQQLKMIMKRIENKYPQTNTATSAYVTTIPGSAAGDGQPVIYTMHIVAILILALASINVGNLLLSRAVERSKETAIRVALGAPRFRLISQMLWESIIICTLGGVIGLLIVAWGLEVTGPITQTFFINPTAFWWKFSIDSYTIKLFFIILITTILVTGLLPAWKNSGNDFNSVLRDGTRGALGKKSGRLNKLLVISEIFISMTILIAASVMVYAAHQQSNQDIGADTDNILTASVLLTDTKYDEENKKIQFAKALQIRLENSAGIGEVMISTALPGDYALEEKLILEGKEYNLDTNISYPRANYISIMPDALKKLGVDLKSGRYFNSSDNGLDKNTALVTQAFVEQHFKDSNAIGKRFRLAQSESTDITWITIVGIVDNTIQGNREGRALPSVFRPFTQSPRQDLTIAMRMKSTINIASTTLRKTLQSIDPLLPSYKIETYSQSNERFTAPIKFISSLTALFGLAAVVLAASGIYGVMSNTITQRTQEIGIKRALGADEKTITKEFIKAGAKQLLWGGIPGIMAGCAMGFAMSQLFGTSNNALIIISISITTMIGSVVMLATYLPTQKALKMEPSDALHHE